MDPALLTIFITHWAEFAVRWLHVITAIAWIGSSFYFIALDLGLRKSGNLPAVPLARNGRYMVAAFIISRNIWSRPRICQNI